MTMENWLLFASLALVAAITPGPAILLATSQRIRFGMHAAVASMLGNITGLFIMSLLAVLGLTTIILMSTTLFTLVKFLGAAYLVYLGVKLWREGFGAVVDEQGGAGGLRPWPGFRSCYLQGLLVALSNPKAIAFTTALFPQFVDATGNVALQFGLLIVTFMTLSFLCLFGYALLAGRAGREHRRWKRYLGRLFGSAFIGSGIAIAVATNK